MVEETRVMIIKQIQEDLNAIETMSWDTEVKASEIIKNLSVAYSNLKEKE